MKRVYITTIVTALLVVAAFSMVYSVWDGTVRVDALKVGFIYENDESTPYTYNFMLAQEALEARLPDRVKIYVHTNVPEDESEAPLHALVQDGCSIIFTNNYSDQIVEAARQYPDVQFCQTSYNAANHDDCPDNYHTFNGAIYQARYACGIAAGLKLRDMIDNRVIDASGALVGYVGAYPSVEVISGYTAFLLGVRSVVPEATMRVRYTHAWSSYNREKDCTRTLIDEGCVVICQHTDTIGPAMACEEAKGSRPVIHVGYNQSMVDIAPSTSLISTRVNWTPYVVGAVEALLEGREIEKSIPGDVFGNDMCAGFDHNWVELTELNRQLAPYDAEEKLAKAVDALRRGTLEVFKGNYIGVDPDDPSDTVDLSKGYRENANSSWPTFHYLLKDVITVEE
jgi:basic membrane protein A